MTVKFITLRFNIEKEWHRRGWEVLQKKHDIEGGSYTDVVLRALLRDAENGAEKSASAENVSQNSVDKIAAATAEALRNTLLHLFSGLSVQDGIPQAEPSITPSPPAQEKDSESKDDIIPDDEIPWDYLEG